MKKHNDTILPYVLLAASVLLSASAQLLMKAGMITLNQSLSETGDSLVNVILANHGIVYWVAAGILCYGLSMLAWLLALVKHELSFAYPFLGLSYVLVYIGAVLWPFIGETMSLERTLGVVLILIGTAFVNYRKPS